MKTVIKIKEKIIYENSKGKIIKFEDYWGGTRYCLFDENGNYIKDIPVPFKVSDYL